MNHCPPLDRISDGLLIHQCVRLLYWCSSWGPNLLKEHKWQSLPERVQPWSSSIRTEGVRFRRTNVRSTGNMKSKDIKEDVVSALPFLLGTLCKETDLGAAALSCPPLTITQKCTEQCVSLYLNHCVLKHLSESRLLFLWQEPLLFLNYTLGKKSSTMEDGLIFQ